MCVHVVHVTAQGHTRTGRIPVVAPQPLVRRVTMDSLDDLVGACSATTVAVSSCAARPLVLSLLLVLDTPVCACPVCAARVLTTGCGAVVADDMFTAAQDLVFEGHSGKAAALARCCAELKPRDAQVRSFLSSLFLGSNSFADGERWCAPLGR